jgi:hypothetical protein
MTTTITDPTTLEGFTEVDGIRVSPIGDDGELLIALGRHDVIVAVRAFLKAGHGVLWDDPLAGFDELEDAAACVSSQWGQFTLTDGGADRSGWDVGWGIDLKDAPGATPITVFDIR